MNWFFDHCKRYLFSISPKRFVGLLFAVALIIRVTIVFSVGNIAHPEMYEHGEIAKQLYQGNGFSMHWPYDSFDTARKASMLEAPAHEGAFIPPLNPYLIYFAFVAFGQTPAATLALMLLYALCSASAVVIIYATARMIHRESSARITGIISALLLPAAIAITTFSGSSVYQLVGALIFYFAIRLIRFATLRDAILLGCTSGIMVLLRSEFLILGFILIAIASASLIKQFTKKIAIKSAIVSSIICLCIVLPWTIRNYNLFDRVVPVLSHPWYEIWRGNNHVVENEDFFSGHTYIWVNREQFPRIIHRMDSLVDDRFFEVRVNDIFHEEFLAEVSTNPAAIVKLAFKKLLFFLTIDTSDTFGRNPLYILSMLFVIPLILIGLYKSVKDKSLRDIGIIYLTFFLYYLAIIVSTFVLPRYQIYVFHTMLPIALPLGTGLLRSETPIAMEVVT